MRISASKQYFLVAAVALGAAFTAGIGKAAVITWSDLGTAWNVAGSWTGTGSNGSPTGTPGTNDVATFNGATNNISTNVAATRTIDGLNFTSLQTTSIDIGGLTNTVILTLDGGATTDINVGAGHHTITGTPNNNTVNEVSLNGTQVWNVAANSSLTFNVRTAVGSNGGTIAKNGSGTVAFTQSNGGGSVIWTLNDGTVRLSGDGTKGNSSNSMRVNAGATLELNNASYSSINTAGTSGQFGLRLNGTGLGGNGAVYVPAGVNSLIPSGTGINAAGYASSFGLEADSSINVATGGTLRITDDISGTGGLIKTGAGKLVIEAAGHYQGATVVQGGTLLINTASTDTVLTATPSDTDNRRVGVTDGNAFSVGQLVTGTGIPSDTLIGAISLAVGTNAVILTPGVMPGGGPVEYTFHAIDNGLYADGAGAKTVAVQAGATLGGTGRINNTAVTVSANGFLAPGASIGTFSVGSADIDGTLLIEIDETNALVNDLLNVVGDLNIEDAIAQFSITGGLTLPSYTFATYGGTLSGTFGPGNAPSGYTFDYSVPGEVSLMLVPEPASVVILGIGVLGVGGLRRRRFAQ